MGDSLDGLHQRLCDYNAGFVPAPELLTYVVLARRPAKEASAS